MLHRPRRRSCGRKPALHLKHKLTRPVGEEFWFASLLLPVAFRGRQCGKKRKRPHASGPRNIGQQHQAQPPQTTGFDEMGIGRANWITIDAAGANPGSPASLDGVIEPEHQRSTRDEGGQQHTKQDETGMATTPDGTVQSPMVILKMTLIASSPSPAEHW